MKKIIILVLCVFFSCTDKQNELKYLICKDSIQYWNYEWPRERAKYYGFTFSFDKRGELKKYSFDKVKNRRTLFWDIQDPGINKWSVTKDSILKIMGDEEKIIRYTEDTIYAIDIKYKIKSYYIRETGDLHIDKYTDKFEW